MRDCKVLHKCHVCGNEFLDHKSHEKGYKIHYRCIKCENMMNPKPIEKTELHYKIGNHQATIFLEDKKFVRCDVTLSHVWTKDDWKFLKEIAEVIEQI